MTLTHLPAIACLGKHCTTKNLFCGFAQKMTQSNESINIRFLFYKSDPKSQYLRSNLKVIDEIPLLFYHFCEASGVQTGKFCPYVPSEYLYES